MPESEPWLTVVGIGEDGLAGLGDCARQAVAAASLLVGGRRHLAMVPLEATPNATRMHWPTPFNALCDTLAAHAPAPVCVLATGDPMWFGVGAVLARRFGMDQMRIVPAPSSFSLACARLGWSLPDTRTLSVHGRAVALLAVELAPAAKLLVLSAGAKSPREIAAFLCERGYGASSLTIMEHLGGPKERVSTGTASKLPPEPFETLNIVAVECIPGQSAGTLVSTLPTPNAATPGLADSAYEHDGQLTKQTIRAVTVCALAPATARLLWDVGAGCGSVAIEWLRAAPGASAIAIERQERRVEMARRNATRLNASSLQLVHGECPTALVPLSDPDAVFIGGAGSPSGRREIFAYCWSRLRPGGALVVNAVTLEGERHLTEVHSDYGGELIRIATSQVETLGKHHVHRPALAVTQLKLYKAP